MRKLIKFLALPSSEQRLLIGAWVVVGLVRLGLCLLPYRTLCALLGRFEQAKGRHGAHKPSVPVDRIVWAVKAASRILPSATCLTQAMASKALLRRNGYLPTLRIGATKNGSGEFLAHAWLEYEGRVLIGGVSDLSRYRSFPSLADRGS